MVTHRSSVVSSARSVTPEIRLFANTRLVLPYYLALKAQSPRNSSDRDRRNSEKQSPAKPDSQSNAE